jgi:hypothetical protein
MHLWVGAMALATVIPTSASAQHVRADVIIATGPVAARVAIGSPRVYERVIVHSPRRLTVHRYRADHRYGHRVIREVVYYDPHRDRFYDGYRSGLHRVEVYRVGGRYYRQWDRREWTRHERRDNRYDRRDDRRDDRRFDRNDRRDDRRDGRDRARRRN